MAAALLRARLDQDEERQDWQVLSAGTWASEGRPASAYTIAEMLERGIDMSPHRSRNIAEALIRRADLVLVMTRDHAEALSVAFPDQSDKLYLLSDMVRETYDIPDPYGGTRLEYSYVAQDLERLIDAGYHRIVSLAEQAPNG
jgi:protein-tyrosine phosphatase